MPNIKRLNHMCSIKKIQDKRDKLLYIMDSFSEKKSNSCKKKNNYFDYQHFITEFMLNLNVSASLELLHTLY